jgi:hypothetical protein
MKNNMDHDQLKRRPKKPKCCRARGNKFTIDSTRNQATSHADGVNEKLNRTTYLLPGMFRTGQSLQVYNNMLESMVWNLGVWLIRLDR